MKKLFPTMLDTPSAQALAGGIPYWLFAYVFFPAIMMFSSGGIQNESYAPWMEIGCHIINFVVIFLIFFAYMRDSFLTLQVSTREVLIPTAISIAIIMVLKVAIIVACMFFRSEQHYSAALGSVLISEGDLLFYSTGVLGAQPLWGTLCFTVLTPITTACLLYASVFAPLCERRPWLAYLVMTAMLLLKHLAMAFCLWPLEEELAIFLVTLPVHLVACWSYQKADTVWAPILVHAVSNLLSALLALWLFGIL